jgi:hypothetical protein
MHVKLARGCKHALKAAKACTMDWSAILDICNPGMGAL